MTRLDVVVCEVASERKLKLDEDQSWEIVAAWMSAIREFPTAHNVQGVTAAIVAYQAAWMNGRVRPEGETT